MCFVMLSQILPFQKTIIIVIEGFVIQFSSTFKSNEWAGTAKRLVTKDEKLLPSTNLIYLHKQIGGLLKEVEVKWMPQTMKYDPGPDLWHQVYKRVSLGNRPDPNVGAAGCEGDPGQPYLPIRILKEARAEPQKKFPSQRWKLPSSRRLKLFI